jgi:DNA-binding transcriptional LysR family regulator
MWIGERARRVSGTELNLALVAAPPEDSQMIAVPIAAAHLCPLVPDGHTAAQNESLLLQDLAQDGWILFSKHVHPLLRDGIIEVAQREAIVLKDVHDSSDSRFRMDPLKTQGFLEASTRYQAASDPAGPPLIGHGRETKGI